MIMGFDDNFRTINEEEFVFHKSSIARNILGFLKTSEEHFRRHVNDALAAQTTEELLMAVSNTVFDRPVKEAMTLIIENENFGGVLIAGVPGVGLEKMREILDDSVELLKEIVSDEFEGYCEAHRFISKNIDQFSSGFCKMIVELVESNYKNFSDLEDENIVEYNFYEAMFGAVDNLARELGRHADDDDRQIIMDRELINRDLRIKSPIYDTIGHIDLDNTGFEEEEEVE